MTQTEIITFGCRLNVYESEVIRSIVPIPDRKRVIINTCAVTSEAERQARQAIRRARRTHPDAEIIVTGCAAQINPQHYQAMPDVTRVLGNEEKLQPESYTGDSDAVVGDIMSLRDTALHLVESFDGHARAFVQIQQGCNHRCTFCIIPYGRGNSRSVPMGHLFQQIQLLQQKGYQEIVLTGVDITSYGSDLPGTPTLGSMLKRFFRQNQALPRLRLSSIDPAEIDDDLLDLFAHEPRLMPHVHLSLQAGDNLILKRMKRRHSREDVLRACEALRHARPDIVFGGDIIAGFPTETEDMFLQSLAIVKEADISYLHVFPYSERDGTPAARMPAVDKAVRKERAERLRQLGKAQEQRLFARHLGTVTTAIIEQGGIARTPHFIPVRLTEAPAAGTLCEIRLDTLASTGVQGSLA